MVTPQLKANYRESSANWSSWERRRRLCCLLCCRPLAVTMDNTRGSLDRISRPASSSRAYPNGRSSNTSMELLTPEPCLPKDDSPVSLAASYQRDSLEDSCPEENKGLISSSDSGDESTETQTSKFCEFSQGTLSLAKAANSSNLEYSEETDVDPQIQAAIKKMKKLDTILAKKHFKERAIKKQGKEIRAKLWEELKFIGTTGSHEEIENTKLFLTLMSSWQDTADYPRELETNEILNQAEKMHSKSKSNEDLIKKNIEEDVSAWLAPGEGYTPEPMEFHHLTEIDMKLHLLLSDGDFSVIPSSCSKSPSQIYQESLVYANRSLETVPGEKVLRDNREQRDQQNRLREIDHQLQSLERNPTEEQMGLSEEQLKTLLEECMQPWRTISNVTMPKSQESLSCGLSLPCYTSQDSTLHSTSTLSKMLVEGHIVGMLTAQEKAGLADKSLSVNAESEIPAYYVSKALADSHLSKDSLAQTEEPDDLEGLQKMADKSITEGYFMSRALNTERLKKPSFLGEPLYCISVNNEASAEADILSIPLQTKGGETLNSPFEKAFDYDEKSQAGSHQRYAPIHTDYYGEARMYFIKHTTVPEIIYTK
ncbi:fibrous sheath-interacting protein 1 isoform X3 [Patagioenas fasciata]|uniref:fibrous sheath-interacting protein 1 isoform X3 n=1 Tax=Patagioenas fasciata TaxID=372321 RepID=UPI003A99BD1C